MTTTELAARYRNLLVVLSKNISTLNEEAEHLREVARSDISNGHKAGLNCKANALLRQSARLHFMIHKNNAALRHFFGTTNLDEVAQEQLKHSG